MSPLCKALVNRKSRDIVVFSQLHILSPCGRFDTLSSSDVVGNSMRLERLSIMHTFLMTFPITKLTEELELS